MKAFISAVAAATVFLAACSATEKPSVTEPSAAPTLAKAPAARWRVLYEEDFDKFGKAPTPAWVQETYQPAGNYDDNGYFFLSKGIVPPVAYRARAAFSTNGWLTVESYSRSTATPFSNLFRVVTDPGNSKNKVLRVASPLHTDATVIRPTLALPANYRVCLSVGYANFGSGASDAANLNGYLGGERSEPWTNNDATLENGFYWLAITDWEPHPRNNVWAHHHRKVVIDSDNNKEAWTTIWNGSTFLRSGEHPVNIFAVDKDGVDNEYIGKPFIMYANGALQPSGAIRSADAYKDNTWYDACIERNDTQFVLTVSGDFRFGGKKTYTAAIDVNRVFQGLPGPDWFMFGDPHNNYYRGEVYFDNVRMEVLK